MSEQTTADYRRWGDTYVYCASHMRVHSTGWCTVPNSEKTPIKADTLEEAEAAWRDSQQTDSKEPGCSLP